MHAVLDYLAPLSTAFSINSPPSDGSSTPPSDTASVAALSGDGDGERRSSLREAAAPFLHELHQQTGMVVHLTVLDGPDVVDLDKVGGRFAAAIPSRVGGHAPAHCTAGGKAILAWIAPERVDALFGSVLSRSTENTITDINVLHQELSRIRRAAVWPSSEESQLMVWPASLLRFADTKNPSAASPCAATTNPFS
ncbi:hypothetical protein GCM10020255_004220 [Rhodococcus baikonurensis]